jgi:hypothetical protein
MKGLGMNSRSRMLALALALALTLMLALAGCVASPKPPPQRSPFAGQWTFTGGEDARGALSAGDIPSGLTIGPGTSVTGRGPCRDYSLDLFGQPGAVFVKVRHVSFGVCDEPAANQLDVRMLAALRATTFAGVDSAAAVDSAAGVDTAAGVDGRILTLKSSTTTLDFRPAPAVNMSALLESSWTAEDTVQTISGNNLVVDATLRFPTKDTLTLSIADCATVTAHLKVVVGYILISKVLNRDVTCEAAQSTGLRVEMLDLLSDGFTFSGAPGGLFITNPRLQETVRFTS